MKKLISNIAGLVDLRDVVTFGGIGMVGYGLFAIYPPASFVVVGAMLFWIGTR